MKLLAYKTRAMSKMDVWTPGLLFTILMCKYSIFILSDAATLKGSSVPRRCVDRACSPPIGNLALGRVLTSRSVCGVNLSQPYCFYKQSIAPRGYESCTAIKCSRCNAAIPHQAHLTSAMSDSSFRFPDTWWQSEEGVKEETLQLDLETEFYFTHLILVFRSPRPAAMVLERSQDYGHSWKTLSYFAKDCEKAFGMANESPLEENEAACTSKYSKAYPCTRGEVIYRALSPWRSVDPYGPSAQTQLMVTNLRLRLLQHHPCPCQDKYPAATKLPTHHYAIYDFIVKGSCLCNGHAEHCVPANGYRLIDRSISSMVHGKCVCRHNTAGNHCQHCAPLFNDQPWRAANGLLGTRNQCRRCECNGRAESCHFSRRLWLASGRRSGGVCDACHYHTEGRHCQNCERGFYTDSGRPKTTPDSCKPCACHSVGSVLAGGPCNPSNGECTCKAGVGGPQCDQCMLGYWGLHEYGCRLCDCAGNCDPYTGDCDSDSDAEVSYTATGHMGHRGNNSELTVFRAEELFSALHHSDKCKCVEMTLGSPKIFCSMEYDYVLAVQVMSAHDRGSHAEVEVMVRKVLHVSNTRVNIRKGGHVILYPEPWTTWGCTCPIMNPGSEYVVAGYQDRNKDRLMVNTKSLVIPWRSSLGHKLLYILRKHCGHQMSPHPEHRWKGGEQENITGRGDFRLKAVLGH